MIEDRARLAHLLTRGSVDPRDEDRGVDGWVVEQHLRVGDRIQRRRVDDHHAAVGGELREYVGHAFGAEQLGGIMGQRAGRQHEQVGKVCAAA